MAAPFNLEDLAKLKSFVEFVAANPTVLNLPQLDFLKKLIEQLGGKVPEGTFQMPAGAKCPFGGDVKSESKFTPPPASADEDEEDLPEMEAESEESEVELDMEANNSTVLEPNILYLDEKPPKIFKVKKTSNSVKRASKKARKKAKTKKIVLKRSSTNSEGDSWFKKERRSSEESFDPLYTAKVEVKCELSEQNQDKKGRFQCENENVENSEENDKMTESKCEKSENEYDEGDDDDDYDDDVDHDYNENEDDDEPLIFLTRGKGRPRKRLKEEDDVSIKVPRSVECREICRQSCLSKFSEEERKHICDYYWNLDKETRLVFIRKHTRVRRLTRMKRVNAVRNRGHSFCYYLKYYRIGKDESIPDSSMDLIRVCRKFFESTLCITNHYIKKANDGSIQEIERDILLRQEINLAREKLKEKTKEPKLILDPETGNLTTPAAKAKQAQKDNKRKRRKPGDPEPEHFPKPIKCFETCIHKCHENFNEEERKRICDFFWSMDYKRRKDFVLANMEVKDIETETTPDFRKTNRPPRAYQSRFYMRSGGSRGEKVRVCKDFFTKTLLVNRYFIKNAIEFSDKATGCYTGSDRRGVHEAPNKISDDRKQKVMDHIESYPFWVPNKKSKTKYLHHDLTIKKMYDSYKEKCLAERIKNVNVNYYYRIFHDDFQILFLTNPLPRKGWGLLKKNPNISQYTGKEAGGYWIDSKENKIDIESIDPTIPIGDNQKILLTNEQKMSSFVLNTFASSSDNRVANSLQNPTTILPFKTFLNPQPSLSMFRPDLSAANFGNIPTDSVNMLRML